MMTIVAKIPNDCLFLKYCNERFDMLGEWVGSFLTAHQHIIGYFSALQWFEYRDKIVEI